MARTASSRSSADLRFRHAIASRQSLTPYRPAQLIGVEHEFTVGGPSGPVDFRAMVHELGIAGRRLDPGDPNAYRCEWGGVITADGMEAEIAIPPVVVEPDFTGAVRDWAATGRAALRAHLPGEASLAGFSTHISVAMPDRLLRRATRTFTHRFAPALMMLMEAPESPGLLVRPRPRRLELCGEHVAGARLRGVACFAAGAAIASARRSGLPPAIVAAVAPATGRPGWYVDRAAFGADLYRDGRATLLRCAGGGTITAQAMLERAWEVARAAVAPVASAEDLAVVDDLVAGRMALGLEDGAAAEVVPAFAAAPAVPPILGRWRRDGFVAEVVVATWHAVVVSFDGPRRTAFGAVPAEAIAGFVDAIEAGLLDEPVAAFLATAPGGRVLASADQAGSTGLYDRVGTPTGLVLPEPPAARWAGGGGVGGGSGHQKDRREPPPPAARKVPRALVIAGIVIAVLLVAGTAVALTRGGGKATPAAAPPTTKETTTTTVAAVPVPAGPSTATAVAIQDGQFTTAMTVSVGRQVVRAGDLVSIDVKGHLAGANFQQDETTGVWAPSCAPAADQNVPTNGGPGQILLAPYPATSAAAMVDALQGNPPVGLEPLSSNSTVIMPIAVVYSGCDVTFDDEIAITFAANVAPGEYIIAPNEFLFQAWTDNTPDEDVYDSGAFPTVLVTA